MSTADQQRICLRVCFTLHDGAKLFPIRVKNRNSGKVAFRLSEGGAGGNTIASSREVEAVPAMIDLVCRQGKAIRLSTLDGRRNGLYRKGGRSVHRVALDGVAI